MSTKGQANLARRRARRCLVQALYQWQLTNHDAEALDPQYFIDEGEGPVDRRFLESVLREVLERVDELDGLLVLLLDRVDRQHAAHDRHPGLEGDVAEALHARAGDVVEVRGGAPDHGAEGNDGLMAAAGRERLGGDGQLERTRHAHDVDRIVRNPVPTQDVERALHELLDDEAVEPGSEQRKARIPSIREIALDGTHSDCHASRW